MNNQTAYTKLIQRLDSTRRKEIRVDVVTALATALVVPVVCLMGLSVIEAFMHASVAARTVAMSVLGVATPLLLATAAGRILWSRVFSPSAPSAFSIAERVGNVYTSIRDLLLNALQLVSTTVPSVAVSSQLIDAAFGQVVEATRELDFDKVINTDRMRKALLVLAVSLGVSALLFAATPLGSAAYRLLHFRTSFVPPAPFTLRVDPKQREVLRGSKVTVFVRAAGVVPATVTLMVREDEQAAFDSYTLRDDSSGVFRFELPSVKRSIRFYAEVPWYNEFVRTDTGTITVSDPPLVRSLEGRVLQPAYTRMPAIALDEQHADIACLSGSRVELNIMANKALARAELLLFSGKSAASTATTSATSMVSNNKSIDSAAARQAQLQAEDTVRVPMKVADRKASAQFSVRNSGSYAIRIYDGEGRANADPMRYSITAQNDGYPAISLVEPQGDVQAKPDVRIPIRVTITDDYGFSQLTLNYKLTASRYAAPEKDYKRIVIPMAPSGTSAEVSYLWDLQSIGISPEDSYEFFVEVFDNDRITGPKSARTSVIALRLPSLADVFRQAEKKQDDAAKDLETVMKKAEEVARDMEQMQREMMKQKRMASDWNAQKKMDDMLKQQEAMQEKLQQAQEKLEQMTDMLKENKALSPETLQKYAELQKLMKSIDSKEMRDAMERMKQAMEQMSPEQMQQAMKNFKFNEEDFKKQIERTMQLLKRIQTEQKVDELSRRAEDLQRRQDDLQKQAENTNPSDAKSRDELSKKQDALKEDMKQLAKDAKEMEKLAKEAGLDKQQNVMEQMGKAMDQLNAEMTQQQMSQSSQSMEEGDMQQAQQKMKNASQNLKNFSQSMKKMKQEMRKNLQRETAKQMQSSLNDMMALSKEQEQLMNDAERMDQNSARMSQNARRQQNLREQMMNLANKMNQLGQKSTAVTPEMGKEMGDAMRQMQDAQESMENRNSPAAAMQQKGAMSSMNKAMKQMAGALSKMNGSLPGQGDGQGEGDPMNPSGSRPGGQSGFMQRLQQAANMQQGINSGMQQMGMGQGSMSSEQQAELGRLASQQGKVQKSLEELSKEQKEAGGSKKALGNLEKMAEEMKEILADMQSGRVTDETRRRQDRILSRLLDASRSMNERDYEKTRESRSGENTRRSGPAELDLERLRSSGSVRDLLRSMQQGYTKDYEQIIRQYFEQLQQRK
ncbi:MAG: DUF4175 family protein [Candidatus Kapaibacterium sp.]